MVLMACIAHRAFVDAHYREVQVSPCEYSRQRGRLHCSAASWRAGLPLPWLQCSSAPHLPRSRAPGSCRSSRGLGLLFGKSRGGAPVDFHLTAPKKGFPQKRQMLLGKLWTRMRRTFLKDAVSGLTLTVGFSNIPDMCFDRTLALLLPNGAAVA